MIHVHVHDWSDRDPAQVDGSIWELGRLNLTESQRQTRQSLREDKHVLCVVCRPTYAVSFAHDCASFRLIILCFRSARW